MAPNLFTKLFTAAIAASSVFVVASPSVHKRYDVKSYHPSPRGWNNAGRCPGDHMINLSIGLKQGNFKELERHLYEVSDPRHARYGQHLSAEEVHDLVRPSSQTSDAVHEWLEEHGIDIDHIEYSPANDWVKFAVPISQAERMLDTEYSIWEHGDGSVLVRTESWSLPANLHGHISTIQPTNSWARLKRNEKVVEIEKRDSQALELPDRFADLDNVPLPSVPEIAAVCNFSAVTPTCLRTLYGTINYTVGSNGKSKMGVNNFLEEYNNRSDTYLFLQKYRPEAAQAAYEFTQFSIDGGAVDNGTKTAITNPSVGLEGNLDSEYILGVGWPLNLTTFGTAGRNPTFMSALSTPTNTDEPFLRWANYVLGLPEADVPQVISNSYADDEQTMSQDYAVAVCQQFAQLGARGVSILFASGDYGVGQNDTCYSSKDNSTKMFLPQFPSSCPYVTTVGGTYLYPEQAVYAILGSGNIFASGGGFSNYFDQPSYQSSAVNDYVAGLGNVYPGLYNPKGRAYPDISCVGQRFPTIWNGTTRNLVGTSGSCPICAGVLALVNDALIASGKPVLGFLNPWLYSGGYKAFTDVTNGSSYGCQTDGFPAKVGWDAVTGFGTPYLPNILENLGIGAKGWSKW